LVSTMMWYGGPSAVLYAKYNEECVGALENYEKESHLYKHAIKKQKYVIKSWLS